MPLPMQPAFMPVPQAESKISVAKGARKADLKKLFAVMGLGVKQGEVITVDVEGADEEAAAAAVEAFLKANL